MHKIVPVLDLPLDKMCLWTDSKIVLAWLNMQPHMLKTFVSNRVAKIQSLCSNSQWRHVTSKCNPADVLSRGADTKDLRDNDCGGRVRSFYFVILPILKSILVLRTKLLSKN
ncbi:hypothetical protein AVEN_52916-1 [Araneus ventricosus]|uniref:Uncharacterized protein n=1 Tax=Araneus ventricosus TaxID=182803 RepID=A0A4Y2FDE2_ARAVE|nr:hypothetical protein AVEN_52916-1 [Araneus ventricosus]